MIRFLARKTLEKLDFTFVSQREDRLRSSRSGSSTPCTELLEHVWQDGGAIVAVTPREPFARYFTAAARTRSGARNGSGVKDGSDGTRTRDLCRDRAAL